MRTRRNQWFDSPANVARIQQNAVRDSLCDYLSRIPAGQEVTKAELWHQLKRQALDKYREEAARAYATLLRPCCEERLPLLEERDGRLFRTAQTPAFSD